MHDQKIKIQIFNKKKRFCFDGFIVKSYSGKFSGLMFSKRKNLLFVFNREDFVPLHMFFVFYPIIVFFISEKKSIVEVAQLNPWQLYFPRKKAKYVLEISDFSKHSMNEIKKIKINGKVKWRVI